LLDHETIDGNEVDMLVKGASLEDLRRERSVRERDMAKEQAIGQEAQPARVLEDDFKKASGSDPMGSPAPAT